MCALTRAPKPTCRLLLRRSLEDYAIYKGRRFAVAMCAIWWEYLHLHLDLQKSLPPRVSKPKDEVRQRRSAVYTTEFRLEFRAGGELEIHTKP